MLAADGARLDELLELVLQFARGNLTARMELSPARDRLVALVTGINMLGEELLSLYEGLEDRIAERTAALQAAHAELQRFALTDPLTGLANRTLLADRIGQAIAAAARGARPPAVLVADIDGFKRINDSLGHSAGDAVLVEVAGRLTAVVRDIDTVARLGGDEFAIVLPAATREQALAIGQRALAALRAPVAINEELVWVGASIGLRQGSPVGTAESLLNDADTAMYAAKAAGRGNVQVFAPTMRAPAGACIYAGGELAAAIHGQQLRLYYQPMVELGTGCLVGAEALVRWQHPRRGLLLPAEFLPVAAERGLAADLGRWVLLEAIAQLASWAPYLAGRPEFRVHVNLDPVEVSGADLVSRVRKALACLGVPAERLALDIPAVPATDGTSEPLQIWRQLQELGVGIGIDGPSIADPAVRCPPQLRADFIKLDPLSVLTLGTGAPLAPDVAAAAMSSQSRGLRLLAKGVETADQAARAVAVGCSAGQGYHFSVALPARDLTDLLRCGVTLAARTASVS